MIFTFEIIEHPYSFVLHYFFHFLAQYAFATSISSPMNEVPRPKVPITIHLYIYLYLLWTESCFAAAKIVLGPGEIIFWHNNIRKRQRWTQRWGHTKISYCIRKKILKYIYITGFHDGINFFHDIHLNWFLDLHFCSLIFF